MSARFTIMRAGSRGGDCGGEPSISSIRGSYRQAFQYVTQGEQPWIAIARSTVTAVILSNGLQEESYEDTPRLHGTLHSGFAVPLVHFLDR